MFALGSRNPATPRRRGLVAAVGAATVLGGVLVVSSSQIGSAYSAPCTDATDQCRDQRIASLEAAVAALQGQPTESATPDVTSPDPTTPEPSPSATVAPSETAPPSATSTPSSSPTSTAIPPPSTTATPTPAPAACTDQPTLANTGPRTPAANMDASGSITVTTNGAVIDSRKVSGTITVKANNVTIRDTTVTGSTSGYLINLVQPYTGLTLDHVRLTATTQQANGLIGGVGNPDSPQAGANIAVTWSSMTGYGDGAKLINGASYSYNYVSTTRVPGTTKHTDGMQNSGNSNVAVWCNTIMQGDKQSTTEDNAGDNSAVFVQAYSGARNKIVEHVTIHDNWLQGGVYSVHTGDGKTSSTGDDECETGCLRDVTVYDNHFVCCPQYGWVHTELGVVNAPGHVFGGWDPDGKPVRTGNVF